MTKYVLCATDDNYAPYCGVMLTSLFGTNPQTRFHVFVFSLNMSEDNIRKLKDLSESTSNEIQVLNMSDLDYSGFGTPKYGPKSYTVYFRLLCEKVLPPQVRKVLFLDVDMVVTGDVSELWDVEMNDYAVLAVRDTGFDRLPPYVNKDFYFNAGVMMINLEWWRTNGATEKFYECANEYQDRLWFADQDILNIALEGNVRYIGLKYNIQDTSIIKKNNHPYLDSEFSKNDFSPVIIHYSGEEKPWVVCNSQPLSSIWHAWRKASLWKWTSKMVVTRKTRYNISFRIRQILFSLMSLFHEKYERPVQWNASRVSQIMNGVKVP